MNLNGNGRSAAMRENPVDNRHIHIIVDGCNVKLNFPIKPESMALSDVKRMMLGGVVKT